MKIQFYVATITDDQGKLICYKRFSNQEYFNHYCRVNPEVNPIKFDEANIDKEFNIALDIRRFFKKLFQQVDNVPNGNYQIPLYSQGVVALTHMINGSVQEIKIMRPFSDSEKAFIYQELEQVAYGELI